MVLQEDFDVEQFMDKYETDIKYNMGETCVDSLSIKELTELVSPTDAIDVQEQLSRTIMEMKLTYGHIRGSEKLKKAISEIYNDEDTGGRSGVIEPENLVVTNGAIGGNFLLFYTLVNPGDHVIVADPSYQQLSSVPNVFSSGNATKFPLEFDENYSPDIGKLSKLIEENKTKLLVINNPNNPTGVVWGNEVLQEIVNVCRKHNTYILCDEVYRPLYHSIDTFPKSIVNFGYERTISTGSTSKAFSFAGLRLGWIASPDPELVKNLLSKRDYNTISISMIDDVLATYVLQNYKKILQRNYQLCRDNLLIIENFVESSQNKIRWVKPQGGTTCFLNFTNPKIDTFKMATDLAENHGLLLIPGETFDNKKGFIRIGFANSRASVEGGLVVLKQWLVEKNLW